MKKKLLIYFVLFCVTCNFSKAVNITIIESQSVNAGHDMDLKWDSLLTMLGHTTSIVPNTTLDNTNFFATTDVLIVASGLKVLPPNRINTIRLYLLQGGMVYLQTEYDTTYTSNQAFSFLTNSLGGSFTWTGTVGGTLTPIVTGSLGTTPNIIPPFSYFWYGADATFCSNIESFLNYQGHDLGFIFCGGPGVGRMITTTDQDWIRAFTAFDQLMMENIVYNLTDSMFSCNAVINPALVLGSDTTICPGDTLVLNAGSGYNSYQWQNGNTDSIFTVSGIGTYWVEVTTSCGSYRDSIVISSGACLQPQTLMFSSDTGICMNQCVDFFDMSTNNPTSWQWSFPGGNTLSSSAKNPVNICYNSSGNYDVQLIACNAFGCDTLLISGFISVDTLPIVSLGNDTIICLGDSIVLSVNQGFNSYIWSTNESTSTIVVSSFGTYSVEVNSNTCAGIDSITVNTQNCSPAIVALESSDTVFCDKKCIDFTDLSTNNPTSWQWNFPGAVPSSSTLQNPTNICYNAFGTFDVTLIACNGFGCDTLFLPSFITEYQVPPPPIITQGHDTLYSSPGFTYAWYNNNNPGVIISTNSFYVNSNGGSYFVIISDSIGCQNSSAIFVATGINDWLNNEDIFLVSPNPADDVLNIIFNNSMSLSNIEIRIINIMRQEIYHSKIMQYQTKINLVNAADGIYFVQLKTSNDVFTRKIIITH